MIFSSLLFIYLFLPAVLLVSLFGNTRARNLTLLVASLVFYAWAGVTLVIYLGISILFTYFFGRMIGARERHARWWFMAGIGFELLVLLVFKYSGFFAGMLNDVAGTTWVGQPELPNIVGISFFTFQSITYLIDVKRKVSPVNKDFLQVALYVSFFPKLIAGPITRYHLMEDQIRKRRVSFDLFGEGVWRFVLGLARKVLIADQLALIANDAFSRSPVELTPGIAWIGLIAYALQIYHDFGGYTDMAIGLGLMFGFRLPENFNFPYYARSVTEFWKRWHVTLSEWFRDYLFLPLAYRFSRSFPRERYWIFRADQLIYLPAALITFILCGFWHGAAWGFVIWGGIHGLFISLERMGLSRVLKRSPKFFSHLYLLVIVTLAWVFFRAPGTAEALTYYKALFGLVNNGSTPAFISYYNILYFLSAMIGIVCSTPVPEKVQRFFLREEKPGVPFHVWRIAGIAATIVLLVLSTYYLVNTTYSSFIYFQF